MEIAKLSNYQRVERNSFLNEHFRSRRHSLYLIEKGVFEYTVNGQTYTASASDCVFYKKGSYYDRSVLSPLTLHIFDIDIALFDAEGPIHFHNKDRISSTISCLNRIEGNIKANLPYIEHLMNDVLHEYQFEKNFAAQKTIQYDKRIAKALEIIGSSYHTRISIKDVAESVYLSYPQFNRLFIKQVDMTPLQYINKLRTKKAKVLLYTTDLPISAVAAECGFDDIYYFSNFFKKMTGQSPTEYKKKSLNS